MDHDEAMMRQALEQAERAAEIGEVPVGAIIAAGNQVVVRAHNLRETTNDPTGHAELLAIARAGKALDRWRLIDCTLYVTLEPCIMCAGAIVHSRLDRVVYGAKDPKAGAIESIYRVVDDTRLNHRPEFTGGVLAGECGQVLKDFFRARRR